MIEVGAPQMNCHCSHPQHVHVRYVGSCALCDCVVYRPTPDPRTRPTLHVVESATPPTTCSCGRPVHDGTTWLQPTPTPPRVPGATRRPTLIIIDEMTGIPDDLIDRIASTTDSNPTWTAAPAADIIADIIRTRSQYRKPTNADRTLRNALDAALDAALAHRALALHAQIVPRHVDPLVLSARDHETAQHARHTRKTNPYIDTTKSKTPRRARFGVSSRACARVRQIAQWFRRRACQIARFVVGGYRGRGSDSEQNAQYGGSD